jgi:hypothetical protein
VSVCAHHGDAPVIRGDQVGPPPVLADWERPIFDQVSTQVPAGPPRRRAWIARLDDVGVFNADPPQAAASFQRLADRDAEIACFGHGEPLTERATAQLRAAATGELPGR